MARWTCSPFLGNASCRGFQLQARSRTDQFIFCNPFRLFIHKTEIQTGNRGKWRRSHATAQHHRSENCSGSLAVGKQNAASGRRSLRAGTVRIAGQDLKSFNINHFKLLPNKQIPNSSFPNMTSAPVPAKERIERLTNLPSAAEVCWETPNSPARSGNLAFTPRARTVVI